MSHTRGSRTWSIPSGRPGAVLLPPIEQELFLYTLVTARNPLYIDA